MFISCRHSFRKFKFLTLTSNEIIVWDHGFTNKLYSDFNFKHSYDPRNRVSFKLPHNRLNLLERGPQFIRLRLYNKTFLST